MVMVLVLKNNFFIATLATSHALLNYLTGPIDELIFDTKFVGELRVKAKENLLEMDFPQGVPMCAKQPFLHGEQRNNLQHMLQNVFKIEFSSLESLVSDVQLCKKTRKLLVRVNDPSVLGKLSTSDLAQLPLIDFGTELNPVIKGVMITCQGNDQVNDCVSRYFAPWLGIPEDPVTGSAHTV